MDSDESSWRPLSEVVLDLVGGVSVAADDQK